MKTNFITYRALTIGFMLAALMLILSSCMGMDPSEKIDIEDATNNIYSELSEAYTSADDAEGFFAPIIAFADENYYYYKQTNNALLVVKEPSSTASSSNDDSTEDAIKTFVGGNNTTQNSPEGITLQCSLNPQDKDTAADAVAVALASLENANSTSQISALFTIESDDSYSSLKSVPDEYLDTDILINLNYNKKSELFESSAALTDYTFSKAVTAEDTSDKKVYRLTIYGIPETPTSKQDKSTPNITNSLYDLLAECEGNNIDYNVISFDTETKTGYLPTKATLLVAVDSSDIGKMTDYIESAISKFYDKYVDEDHKYTFSYAATKSESKGISSEDMTEFISMYYMLDDNFSAVSKDLDGNTAAESIINSVDLNTETVTLNVCNRSKSTDSVALASTTFEELANLNGFTFSEDYILSSWAPSEDDYIIETFDSAASSAGLSLSYDDNFNSYAPSVIQERNDNIKIISLGTNIKAGSDMSCSIVSFIEGLSSSSVR